MKIQILNEILFPGEIIYFSKAMFLWGLPSTNLFSSAFGFIEVFFNSGITSFYCYSTPGHRYAHCTEPLSQNPPLHIYSLQYKRVQWQCTLSCLSYYLRISSSNKTSSMILEHNIDTDTVKSRSIRNSIFLPQPS